MKRRFLDRLIYLYLQKRLPENIVPGRGLSKKRVKSLYRGKALRSPIAGLSPVRGAIRSPGLYLRLMREVLRLHKRKLFGEKHRWVGIDTLERGSLASVPSFPSVIANHFGGRVGKQQSLHRRNQLQATEVWSKGLPWHHKVMQLRDAAPTSQLASQSDARVATPAYGHHMQDGVLQVMQGRDSLYSPSQLDEELTKQQERRPSPLLLKLMERNKLRIMYGNIANREMDKLVERGRSTRGGMSDNLFRLLESRIDVFLCRVGFFATIPSARQWVHHGKILINTQVVTTASHVLKPGDVVSISTSGIVSLKESLLERSSKLNILKGEERGQGMGSVELLRSKGISKAEKVASFHDARPVKRTPSDALQNNGGQRRAQSPLNFLKWVGGSRAISARSVPLAYDARRERLRWFNVKPPHAEISFRCLTAIYLYPPQQVILPAAVDVEKIRRS